MEIVEDFSAMPTEVLDLRNEAENLQEFFPDFADDLELSIANPPRSCPVSPF